MPATATAVGGGSAPALGCVTAMGVVLVIVVIVAAAGIISVDILDGEEALHAARNHFGLAPVGQETLCQGSGAAKWRGTRSKCSIPQQTHNEPEEKNRSGSLV